MSSDSKPTVALYINLFVRVDLEKAYILGLEIAKETNSIFQGIIPWNIANREIEYFSFITELDMVNKIIHILKSNLNLTDENMSYTVTPAVRPAQKPPPTIMTT